MGDGLVRGDRILVVDVGLIRLRSFEFIGIRINAIVQVTNVDVIWRLLSWDPESGRSAIQPFAGDRLGTSEDA
jgi:hypothetical protein